MATEDKSDIMADAEVTAGITLELSFPGGGSASYTIKSLDTSKEIGSAEIRGNNLKLEANPTTTIDYSGSLSFHGDKKSYFDDKLFDEDGAPVPGTITITHANGEASGYTGVKMQSEGYTADEGGATETEYDWAALDEL